MKKKRKDFRKGIIHYPYRTKTTTEEYGPHGKIITVRTAVEKTEQHLIPDKENGAWETSFQYGRFRIRHSKTSERYWLFYRDQFLEEISQTEILQLGKRLIKSVDGFREELFTMRNGKPYCRFVLKAESYWKKEKGA
jgi:hypothetical protein